MKKKNNWKETAKLANRLADITGFGLSLVAPIFLLVWGALWLEERFALGDWILIAAIVCGFVTAGCTFYRFVSAEIRRADRESAEYRRRHGGGDKGEA